jgi:aldose 1-epimerase
MIWQAIASVAALLVLATPLPNVADRYTARQNGDIVQLDDAKRETRVSIVPSAGNITLEMRVRGHNVLRYPYDSVEEYKSRGGGSIGIPFLGPWADRLDEQAFYANGRRYAFDMSLGNVRGANPIHGFLSSTDQWRVTEVKADAASAWVTSKLEFYRNPLWMKQFPFAHTVEMTHRLRDGVLEVATRIENMSIEPMPVAIGFHPYFQVTDSPRDDWTISVGARTHWPVSEQKMPTGQTQAIEKFFPDPRRVALKDYELDDVFTDLVRDDRGRAVMTLTGTSQSLDVVLGPNYRAVVIFAPKRNFVCLEPVAGIINALNLAHRGIYTELQTIPPSGVWQESFWVRPTRIE